MTVVSNGRVAWLDKFSTPSTAELRNGVGKPTVDYLDAVREELRSYPELEESVAWHGVPWRWSLVYRLRQASSAAAPAPGPGVSVAWAYLIPDPKKLQLCVPVTRRQLELLPSKKFKKSVRDGLVFARQVNGTFWPTWELTATTLLDELFELTRAKQKLAATSAVVTTAALAAAR